MEVTAVAKRRFGGGDGFRLNKGMDLGLVKIKEGKRKAGDNKEVILGGFLGERMTKEERREEGKRRREEKNRT